MLCVVTTHTIIYITPLQKQRPINTTTIWKQQVITIQHLWYTDKYEYDPHVLCIISTVLNSSDESVKQGNAYMLLVCYVVWKILTI